MLTLKKFAFSLFFFLAFLGNVFSLNLYSILDPIAVNQNFAPLENVSFIIYCSSEQDDRLFEMRAVVDGMKKLCTTNEAGRCEFRDGITACYGCTAYSTAIIKARYYSMEMNATIKNWDGYSCVYLRDNCCFGYEAGLSRQYSKDPTNKLEPFVFTTYKLKVLVVGENKEPIKDANVIANSPDAFYAKCNTDANGECMIKNIPENARYNIKASFKEEENETVVTMDSDKIVRITLVKEEPIVEPVVIPNITEEPNITKPKVVENYNQGQNISKPQTLENWFLYTINKIDELIGKEKQKKPKLRLVFVPIGFSDKEYTVFKSKAEFVYNDFISKSPFKDCRDKTAMVEPYYLKIDEKCNIPSCNDHCTDCISKARQCVLNNSLGNIYDKFVAITNSSFDGGCAGNIPNDGSSTHANFPNVTIHEIGHTLGLCHDFGCGAKGYCKAGCPNQDVCGPPSVSEYIMDYCNGFDRFGPQAYNFLKTNTSGSSPNAAGLGKWVVGC